jgi:hypothetical protein
MNWECATEWVTLRALKTILTDFQTRANASYPQARPACD